MSYWYCEGCRTIQVAAGPHEHPRLRDSVFRVLVCPGPVVELVERPVVRIRDTPIGVSIINPPGHECIATSTVLRLLRALGVDVREET